jgi:hypothetical protein
METIRSGTLDLCVRAAGERHDTLQISIFVQHGQSHVLFGEKRSEGVCGETNDVDFPFVVDVEREIIQSHEVSFMPTENLSVLFCLGQIEESSGHGMESENVIALGQVNNVDERVDDECIEGVVRREGFHRM